MILIGYCLCIAATIAFGLLSHLPMDPAIECAIDTEHTGNYKNSKLFFALSLVTRFIQGVGDSMVATSSYSIVSIEFPN